MGVLGIFIFYRFNILPQHLADPRGEGESEQENHISGPTLFAAASKTELHVFLDRQRMESGRLFSWLVTMFKESTMAL